MRFLSRKPKLADLWPIAAFIFILLLSISARITLLEERDYWYDEAFTGIVLQQDTAGMHDIILNDVHPPFYYWKLAGWSAIAGQSPISLRLFSVFAGVLTVILAFIALRLWFPKSWIPAVIGSFVFAINPFLSNYSQEARMYTLLGFLLLLAAICLWQIRKSGHWVYKILYGISAAAILLTHYLGFVFMLGFFLYDLWEQYQKHPHFKKWREYGRWFFSHYSIPLVAGLAWLPFFIKQAKAHNTLGWVPKAALSDIPLSLHKFLFGSPVGVSGVPPALGYRVEWLTVPNVTLVIFLALTVLVIWLSCKKKWDKKLGFLAFMTAFPLLLTWLLQAVELQLYVERFLSGSAIFLLLFLIASLYHLGKTNWLYGLVGIYTFLVVMIQPWPYQTTFPLIKSQIEQSPPEETIVFTNPFDWTVAIYYAGPEERKRIKLYNLANPTEDFSKWAIINDDDQITALPNTKHTVITKERGEFTDYIENENVNGFSILQSS